MSSVSSLFSTATVPVHLVGTRPTPSWLWLLPGCSLPAPEKRNSEVTPSWGFCRRNLPLLDLPRAARVGCLQQLCVT